MRVRPGWRGFHTAHAFEQGNCKFLEASLDGHRSWTFPGPGRLRRDTDRVLIPAATATTLGERYHCTHGMPSRDLCPIEICALIDDNLRLIRSKGMANSLHEEWVVRRSSQKCVATISSFYWTFCPCCLKFRSRTAVRKGSHPLPCLARAPNLLLNCILNQREDAGTFPPEMVTPHDAS
jgi:hypothetical protein